MGYRLVFTARLYTKSKQENCGYTQKFTTSMLYMRSYNQRYSGVTRLQWARVQVFQKGPLFPKKTLKTASGKFLAPHSAGPACTARLARPIVTTLQRYIRQSIKLILLHVFGCIVCTQCIDASCCYKPIDVAHSDTRLCVAQKRELCKNG